MAELAAAVRLVATSEPPVPPALEDPSGVWIFNWVIPIVGSIFILLAIADTIRRRRLTWGFLFLVSSLGVYWMETIGDWGQHLVYSPAFAEHHLLDWVPLKTPNDPVFMPFAYAVYWGVHAIAILWLGQLLQRRFGWTMLRAVLVLAVPVNYVWDFLVEGTATAMGWWTYDPGIGPSLRWSSGGNITLLWTIGLMSFWPNLIAYWAGKPPVRTLSHLERFFRLERFTRPRTTPVAQTGGDFDSALDYEVAIPRWRFEIWRLVAWVVGFQVSFFVLLIVPLVLMRWLTGIDSPYVP